MRILEIAALHNGAHRNQTWDSGALPKGYAAIPGGLETPNFPFGTVEVEEVDGVLTVTRWTPGVLPESAPEEEPPAPLTDRELAQAILGGVNEI